MHSRAPIRYADVPPNQTLYVNNLNEKTKIPELKACLFELFSTYGEVIDVIATASIKRKGQAFLVFRDISCATNALRALQGFSFLDKAMRIAYCRTKSDIVAHEDGTYKPRVGKDVAKKDDAKKTLTPASKQQKTSPAATAGGARSSGSVPFMPHPGASTAAAAASSAGGGGSGGANEENPSNVLFVENLPSEVNELMLTMLFRQYPGFQEARLIKGRDVAFIEYGDELQAGIAKHGLQGFMVTPDMALKIAFAKK